MLTGILFLMLTSPPRECPSNPCLVTETELEWRLCQPRVIYLGRWDPVFIDWYPTPMSSAYSEPKEYGAYATEKREP